MYIIRRKNNPGHYYYGDYWNGRPAFTMEIQEAARWKSKRRAKELIEFMGWDKLELEVFEERQVWDVEKEVAKKLKYWEA